MSGSVNTEEALRLAGEALEAFPGARLVLVCGKHGRRSEWGAPYPKAYWMKCTYGVGYMTECENPLEIRCDLPAASLREMVGEVRRLEEEPRRAYGEREQRIEQGRDCLLKTSVEQAKEIEQLSARLERAEGALHRLELHPDYEYVTAKGPRKASYSHLMRPEGEDWIENLHRGRPGEGWDRFDYHEEAYWMRLKAVVLPDSEAEKGQ